MDNEITKSVARNTTIQMIQQIVTWASTFILMLFLPRYLGPVEYGRLYLAGSIAGLFLIFIDYDGRTGIAKNIARNPENASDLLVNAISFRIIIWYIACIGLIIFALITNYSLHVKILLLIFAFELVWLGSRTVLQGIFQGFELLQYSSYSSIAEKVFVSVAGIIALFMGANSIGIGTIMVAGSLLGFLISVRFIKKIIHKISKFDRRASINLIKEGFPIFLWTIFGVIYYRVDTIMLSFMTPEKVVGWYGAAYKFYDVLNFLPSIFTISIFPILSKLWKKEEKAHTKATQKSIAFLFLAAIPISVTTYFFSTNIIQLFYGLNGYEPSVGVLKILGIGLVFLYIDMILGTTLIASDKQKQLAFVALFATPLNVIINYFLIPYTQINFNNGGLGAAVATLLTEIYVMIFAICIMPRGILKGFKYSVLLKGIFSGIIIVGCFYLMYNIGIYWIFQIIISFPVYLALLYAMKVFDPREIELAKNYLNVSNFKKMLQKEKK